LIAAGVGIAFVWRSVKITYTATSQVQVLPIVPRILYEDEETQMMPAFDGFLHTQAKIMTCEGVLRDALRDRSIRGLPLALAEDPVSELRRGLRAAVVPQTFVVELSATRNDSETAKTVAKSILTAYRVRVGEAEEETRRTRREKLQVIKRELETNRDRLQKAVQDLARMHQASSPETLEAIRGSVAEERLRVQQEWSKASLEVEQLEVQLAQVKQVTTTGPIASPAVVVALLPDEKPEDRTAAIERDPMVQALRKGIEAASLNLVELTSAKTDSAPDITRVKSTLTELKKALDKELERAAAEYERARLETAARMKDLAVAALENKLARARTFRDQLKRRVGDVNTELMHVGQADQELLKVRSKLDEVEKYYREVTQEITRLDTEKDRAGRISVISDAEVHADGVKDRRPRLSFAIALGALILAVGLGFLTGRSRRPVIPPTLDPHGSGESTA